MSKQRPFREIFNFEYIEAQHWLGINAGGIILIFIKLSAPYTKVRV